MKDKQNTNETGIITVKNVRMIQADLQITLSRKTSSTNITIENSLFENPNPRTYLEGRAESGHPD